MNKLFKIIFLLAISIPASYTYAALSCSITTSALCANTVLLRMSASTNAHSELPSQSTPVYNGNVVCCSGLPGLSNSCSESNKKIIVKLSGVTNAHVEENTESNYSQSACLSTTYPGDEVTIGYQTTDCTGYDTTLFSMSNTPTNSQTGIPSSYNNKVCAKISSQSLSFNISNHSIGFGQLSSNVLRYATSDGLGSNTEVESYALTASTNSPNGYGLYVEGDTLTNGGSTIDAIGGTNLTPSVGTKAFGLRLVASGGLGTVVSPYDGSGFAYSATGTTDSNVAGATSGNGVETTYSVRTVASIDTHTIPGTYSTNLTYIIVANF